MSEDSSYRKECRPEDLYSEVCSQKRGVNPKTLEQIIIVAVEIARETGRVGTMFTVGDSDGVLKRSRCLILDPLLGHPHDAKRIHESDVRGTVKELAHLDGAFVVSDEGVVISGCRYINASSQGLSLPLGFGTRHMAGASITKETGAVAVIVSESGMVRLFDDGELVTEIIPEIWMLSRHSLHLKGPYTQHSAKDVTVYAKT